MVEAAWANPVSLATLDAMALLMPVVQGTSAAKSAALIFGGISNSCKNK